MVKMNNVHPFVIVFFLVSTFNQGQTARQKFDRRHVGSSTEPTTEADNGQQVGNDASDNLDSSQDHESWSSSNDQQGSPKSYEESIPQMPEDVRKWLKKPHIKRVVRRPAAYPDNSYKRATSLPPIPMPPHSYPYPAPSSPSTSHENPYGDSYSGVFARWNPKINWTNPYFGVIGCRFVRISQLCNGWWIPSKLS